MKAFVIGLALVFAAALLPGTALGQQVPAARIGEIIILGNDRTRMNVILRQLESAGLAPGQILSYPDLRIAERNLTKLGIFQTSPDGTVRPHIEVRDNPLNPASEYKDLIVHVQETSTWRVRLMPGLSFRAETVVSIVWEERNFDPSRWPRSIDDIKEGRAFRGAGQVFRLEMLQIAILPFPTPRFFSMRSFLLPVR